MVTKEDIVLCYKYILGRNPESEDVIRVLLSEGFSDVNDVRKHFINSSEFLNAIKNDVGINAFLPPSNRGSNIVQYEASVKELELILNRIQIEWEFFGKTEPHYSVLTNEEFKADQIEKNKDLFFNSGKDIAVLTELFMHNQNLDPRNMGVCFELGCGVGRITMHMAELFEHVVASDISRYHLGICQAELMSRKISNVDLVLLNSPTALKSIGSFDFFCSFIVLQHNPPPVISFILDTMLDKLRSGGAAVFQVPTYMENYEFNINDYLCNPKPMHMEMHCLPQAQIFRLITNNKCRVIEVREDNWIGDRDKTISNTFFVVKE